jgi:hypothetical protein
MLVFVSFIEAGTSSATAESMQELTSDEKLQERVNREWKE